MEKRLRSVLSDSGMDEELPSCTVHVDELMGRYSDLAAHARSLVFPVWRKGVAAPPDKAHWSKLRKVIYLISSPWPTTAAQGDYNPYFVLAYWWLAARLWVLVGDLWFNEIFGTASQQAPTAEVSAPPNIAVVLVVGFLSLLGISTYWSWFEFARDQRYPPRWRVILTLLFVGLLVSSPFWLITPENQARYPDLLWGNPVNQVAFALGYLLFAIPLLTLLYRVLVDGVILGGRLLWVVIQYIQSILIPLSPDIIQTLSLEPIPATQHESAPWKLHELKPIQLHWLRRWAATKMGSHDKRTLPAVLVLAAVGVFSNTRTFTDAVDISWTALWEGFVSYISWFGTDRSLASPGSLIPIFGSAILVSLIIAFIWWGGKTLLSLGRSLVLDGLICEACLIAEYASQSSQALETHDNKADNSVSLGKRLLRLLWKQ